MAAGYMSSKISDERLHSYSGKISALWVEITNEVERDTAILVAEQERQAQGLDVDEHGMTVLAAHAQGMADAAERFSRIGASMNMDAHSPPDGADVQNP